MLPIKPLNKITCAISL